jgi:hypothetical protein
MGVVGGIDGGTGQLSVTVPDGYVYILNGVVSKLGGDTVQSWAELR